MGAAQATPPRPLRAALVEVGLAESEIALPEPQVPVILVVVVVVVAIWLALPEALASSSCLFPKITPPPSPVA